MLFDEDDPDFAYATANGISGGGAGVHGTPQTTTNGVLRPVSAAACVLNSFMLKGKRRRMMMIMIIVIKMQSNSVAGAMPRAWADK